MEPPPMQPPQENMDLKFVSFSYNGVSVSYLSTSNPDPLKEVSSYCKSLTESVDTKPVLFIE